MRRNKMQLKQFYKNCADEAAARALTARRTTFCCQFSARGCNYPSFLQEARAKTHAAKYGVFNPLHEKYDCHYKTNSLVTSRIIRLELVVDYQPDYPLNYQPDYQPGSAEVTTW